MARDAQTRWTVLVVSGVLALCGLTGGCAAARADRHATPAALPSTHDRERIATTLAGRLPDAEGVHVEYLRGPTPPWQQVGRGGGEGYGVCAMVNPRHRTLGYLGARPYLFLVRADRIVTLAGWDPAATARVVDACQRL